MNSGISLLTSLRHTRRSESLLQSRVCLASRPTADSSFTLWRRSAENFSALWWQRVAGFLVRTSHRLVFCSHILLMYVDDALFWQSLQAVPLNACLLLSFCQVFGYPVSWKKVQMGVEIEYIGWRINFRAGGFYLPQAKVSKLFACHSRPYCLHPNARFAILSVLLGCCIGFFKWLPSCARGFARCIMSKARPLATSFSLPLPVWQELRSYVGADLHFKINSARDEHQAWQSPLECSPC